MSGNPVEIVALDGADAHLRAWRDLSARALEPNVFAEPAFVVNALRSFAKGERLQLLFVWQDASKARLIGGVVLKFARIALGFGVARVWQSNQAGLAAVMLDRDAGEAALAALVDWLARERPGVIGLLLPSLDAAGPTALAVQALGLRKTAACLVVGGRARALLYTGGRPGARLAAPAPTRRVEERGRHERRRKASRAPPVHTPAHPAAA